MVLELCERGWADRLTELTGVRFGLGASTPA
jgi:hypothetical protein